MDIRFPETIMSTIGWLQPWVFVAQFAMCASGVSTLVPLSKGDAALFAAGGRSEQGHPLGLPLMRFARGRKYFSPLKRNLTK